MVFSISKICVYFCLKTRSKELRCIMVFHGPSPFSFSSCSLRDISQRGVSLLLWDVLPASEKGVISPGRAL